MILVCLANTDVSTELLVMVAPCFRLAINLQKWILCEGWNELNGIGRMALQRQLDMDYHWKDGFVKNITGQVYKTVC